MHSKCLNKSSNANNNLSNFGTFVISSLNIKHGEFFVEQSSENILKSDDDDVM